MWLTSKSESCKVCDAKNEYIRYLSKEIDRLTKTIENERSEYKRAVDRILYRESIPPIGQGVPQAYQYAPSGTQKEITSLWDEVKEEARNEE